MPGPKRRASYPSCLTDSQWPVLKPLIPNAKPGGRPRKADKRRIVEAILYQLPAGSAQRLLPHDSLPWQTLYYYLCRLQAEGAWTTVNHTLLMADRERAGREASSRAVINRQGICAQRGSTRGFKGFDAGKTILGRKRHIPADTDGRLLRVDIHGADVQDWDPAAVLAQPLSVRRVSLSPSRQMRAFACRATDGGYAGKLVIWAKDNTNLVLEIVRRMTWAEGSVVIKRRWFV